MRAAICTDLAQSLARLRIKHEKGTTDDRHEQHCDGDQCEHSKAHLQRRDETEHRRKPVQSPKTKTWAQTIL